MKWTEQIEGQALNKLKNTAELPSGVASSYVWLGAAIGLKLYPTAEMRDFAAHKQGTAARHGLAPKVGETFTLPASFHALPVLQWRSCFEETYPSGPLIHGYITQAADKTRPIDQTQKRDLIKRLKSIKELNAPGDLETQDDNFGYVGEQLVLLDFDIGSWS